MLPSLNNESFKTLSWILENAQKGFYLYTASTQMQRYVAEHFRKPNVAVYDYSRDNAPFSFGVLAQWAMHQDAKIFFIINMQVALREDNDIVNFNLSRDLLSDINGIWIFGMTPDTDNRLSRIAYDLYSFIRIQTHFEDEGIENELPVPIISDIPSGKYYDSYEEAFEQMQRYEDLRDELMALPLDSEPNRLLAAAVTLNNIAELYTNYGRYDDALILLTQILTIREKTLGEGHPDTITAYNNIGLVYYHQKDYTKSLEWYMKAVEMFDKEHPNIAAMYNNIALVYNSQNNYAEALKWHKKALEIHEKVFGKEHLNTASTYNNIALVYDDQRDYSKALEWYQKALEINKKVLGNEHPNTTATYSNIAGVYYVQGNYDKALELCNEVLIINEKVFDKQHPYVAKTYSNMADIYRDQGNYDKALELLLKSYKIRLIVFKGKHPATIKTYNYLKYNYFKLNPTKNETDFEIWLKEQLNNG
ncbi:MAG: tetratricopeptide repeat protein [Chitinispirillales bacterium]|jgi:tetratricopeptide (TPR) repeat protein|nr:tetratricopeptide repeat protein [Chitinispirillales bacterium]